MARAITSGPEDGTDMKARAVAAVQSPDSENVYFIAMTFSATGVEDQTGVWASNGLKSGDGLILAMDGIAKQFTFWPDADSTDAAISGADPSVEQATACL